MEAGVVGRLGREGWGFASWRVWLCGWGLIGWEMGLIGERVAVPAFPSPPPPPPPPPFKTTILRP